MRTPGDRFNHLTAAAKQARYLEHERAPSEPCPFCATQTPVADLVNHVERRCEGPRAPHPRHQWVTWHEAKRLGVGKSTMGRWINRGFVRSRGEPRARQYLLRDLAVRIAIRIVERHQSSPTSGTRRRR